MTAGVMLPEGNPARPRQQDHLWMCPHDSGAQPFPSGQAAGPRCNPVSPQTPAPRCPGTAQCCQQLQPPLPQPGPLHPSCHQQPPSRVPAGQMGVIWGPGSACHHCSPWGFLACMSAIGLLEHSLQWNCFISCLLRETVTAMSLETCSWCHGLSLRKQNFFWTVRAWF